MNIEDFFKKRTRWAIEYVCKDRGKEKGHSNTSLEPILEVKKDTINSYRQMRTAPNVPFIIKFCEEFKFNYEWFLFGKGEPFPGARAEFPEVCGPEEEGVVKEPAPEYGKQGADPLISQIKTLFSDFTRTVSDKLDRVIVEKEIQELRSKNKELEVRMAALELRTGEGIAAQDNTKSDLATERKAG